MDGIIVPQERATSSMPRLAASIGKLEGEGRWAEAATIWQSAAKVVNSHREPAEASMTYQTILFENRGPIGLLTFNRPDQSECLQQGAGG